MFGFRRKRQWNNEINLDEIFLDSQNIPNFDTQQFEGKIEKPIKKNTIFFLGSFFVLISSVFVWQLFNLQIKKGEDFFEISRNNTLNKQLIFAERGIIYDRNGVELAWNDKNLEGEPFARRSYLDNIGFSHLLGFVGYPKKDKSGFYWQTELIGKGGVEKQFNDILSGENGVLLFETDAYGDVKSENLIVKPTQGENIYLSIDADLQNTLALAIKKLSEDASFVGGAGGIMDISSGELIALVSYPEFDSRIMSDGSDVQTINKYLNDKNKPFLNRAISGIYTPGSIVKVFIAVGALVENIIDENKEIFSPGFITIPNPYNPDNSTTFREANGRVHGWVDLRKAIAVSSNVYFMVIGGGHDSQKGIGINGIEKYVKMFGLGSRTNIDLPSEGVGTIPSVEWKKKIFPNDPWRLGDTYNTSIGQYGFQITLIQALRSVSAIANNGYLLRPQVIFNPLRKPEVEQELKIRGEIFSIVKEGMREAVLSGTAQILNINGVSIAAKTGTAEVGPANKFNNSWVIGFFPYENPKYAFAVMMDNAPVEKVRGASFVMHDVFVWMKENRPSYLGIDNVGNTIN